MKGKIHSKVLLLFGNIMELSFRSGFCGLSITSSTFGGGGKLRHGKERSYSKHRVALNVDEHPGGDAQSFMPPIFGAW